MELFQIDDAGRLFISPIIEDWKTLEDREIDTVIDLEGDLDVGVPTVPNQCLYIYFPMRTAISWNCYPRSAASGPRRSRQDIGSSRTAAWATTVRPWSPG